MGIPTPVMNISGIPGAIFQDVKNQYGYGKRALIA
jgi:hypothetical protein